MAGEHRAARFLSETGHTVIERNFRTRTGEVDIIAVEGGTIAFCEVKSWERMPIEGLEYTLDRRKQGRILRTAAFYLDRHPTYARLQPRFDVIFIGESIVHLKDAFGESGAW